MGMNIPNRSRWCHKMRLRENQASNTNFKGQNPRNSDDLPDYQCCNMYLPQH